MIKNLYYFGSLLDRFLVDFDLQLGTYIGGPNVWVLEHFGSWSPLGTKMGPRPLQETLQDRFWWILGPNLVDFGSQLGRCWLDFGSNLTDFGVLSWLTGWLVGWLASWPLNYHLSLCPSIHLSIYPSIHLSVHPSIYPSVYPSTYLSIWTSNHISMYPYIHLSIYPSIHLSILYHYRRPRGGDGRRQLDIFI